MLPTPSYTAGMVVGVCSYCAWCAWVYTMRGYIVFAQVGVKREEVEERFLWLLNLQCRLLASFPGAWE